MKSLKFRVQISKILLNLFSCLLISFLLPGLSDLSAAGIITIKVLKKAEIEKDRIRLGKIAGIRGEDPDLVQKLRAIVIGKAPLPGESRQIDENYIKIRLKQNGIDLSQINLQAPQKVEVFRSFIEIPKEKIEKVVLDFIYGKIPGEKSKVRVKNVRVSSNLILPKGNVTYEVILPKNTDFLGSIALPVVFKVNGEFKKKIWATAGIEILMEVVVTKRPLRRYQIISQDDIYLQKRDLTNLPANVIISFEDVLGKRTKRVIDADVALRTDLVELPPLVRRGDVVMIIAESDAVKVTALGEVREKGRRGERIRVVNLASKKEIYGRVLDSNTVKVDF